MAKWRERKFTAQHGYCRPWRRTIDEKKIQEALLLKAEGIPMQECARRVGVSISSLIGRSREKGYVSFELGNKWQAPKIKIPTSEGELGYIAAFIDGEGSITRFRTTKKPRYSVSIANTHLAALEWMQKFGGKIYEKRPSKNSPFRSNKQCYTWVLCRQWDIYFLLKAIIPYMIIKRHLAESACTEIGAIVDQMKDRAA